jgi:hypothetical protein
MKLVGNNNIIENEKEIEEDENEMKNRTKYK